MVRITCALAIWNESPKDIFAFVKGIANIADRLVVVDGAYRRYPGATVKSPGTSMAALSNACKRAGIELIVHRPEELWAGQVAKRTFLLQEAAKDSDWIVVADTDHIIHTDREAARAALEAMPASVNSVAVDFFTPLNPDRPIEESAATNWHLGLAGGTAHWAHIFRAIPDLRVDKKHWIYKSDALGIEMKYGGKADADLGVEYTVEHRALFRTPEQILAGRAFCNDRVKVVAMTGQEDDVPGLPDPVWDYETLPYELATPNAVGSDGSKLAPTLSKEKPNRAPTVGVAMGLLLKGYPAALVARGISVRGETVAFYPATGTLTAAVGDAVVGRFSNGAKAGIVTEIVNGRVKVNIRHGGVHWAKQILGVMRAP